jgi:hypothetical protein
MRKTMEPMPKQLSYTTDRDTYPGINRLGPTNMARLKEDGYNLVLVPSEGEHDHWVVTDVPVAYMALERLYNEERGNPLGTIINMTVFKRLYTT